MSAGDVDAAVGQGAHEAERYVVVRAEDRGDVAHPGDPLAPAVAGARVPLGAHDLRDGAPAAVRAARQPSVRPECLPSVGPAMWWTVLWPRWSRYSVAWRPAVRSSISAAGTWPVRREPPPGDDHGQPLGQRLGGVDARAVELEHDHARRRLREREVDGGADVLVVAGLHDGDRHRHAGAAGGRLDALQRAGVAVVGGRPGEHRHERAPAGAHRAGGAVRAVPERLHRLVHPLRQLGRHVLRAVEDPGDGGHGDLRRPRDIGEDGGSVRLRTGHEAEHTAADNVFPDRGD